MAVRELEGARGFWASAPLSTAWVHAIAAGASLHLEGLALRVRVKGLAWLLVSSASRIRSSTGGLLGRPRVRSRLPVGRARRATIVLPSYRSSARGEHGLRLVARADGCFACLFLLHHFGQSRDMSVVPVGGCPEIVADRVDAVVIEAVSLLGDRVGEIFVHLRGRRLRREHFGVREPVVLKDLWACTHVERHAS